MFIDTHAHLTMPEFKDIDIYLLRAKNAGIEAIVNASFDLDSSIGSVDLAKRFNEIYAAVAIHPHDADLVDDKMIAAIKDLAAEQKVVAIGETGLDYYRNLKPAEVQQRAFRVFLRLAQELDKPVIIHCRDAQDDTIKIMKEENRGALRGVFHCFAGDEALVRFAEEIIFYISFTGNVTFKKAHEVRENAARTPFSRCFLSPPPS